MNHAIADFTSTLKFLQEWAKICRGGAILPHPSVVHVWDRYPLQLFAPINPDDITVPVGMYQPTSDTQSLSRDLPATGVQLDLVFSKNSLEDLKNAIQPLDHEQWVSTMDGVSALLWRSMTKARAAIIEPNTHVHFETAIDVRRHCEDPKANDYFGNLALYATISHPLELIAHLLLVVHTSIFLLKNCLLHRSRRSPSSFGNPSYLNFCQKISRIRYHSSNQLITLLSYITAPRVIPESAASQKPGSWTMKVWTLVGVHRFISQMD